MLICTMLYRTSKRKCVTIYHTELFLITVRLYALAVVLRTYCTSIFFWSVLSVCFLLKHLKNSIQTEYVSRTLQLKLFLLKVKHGGFSLNVLSANKQWWWWIPLVKFTFLVVYLTTGDPTLCSLILNVLRFQLGELLFT